MSNLTYDISTLSFKENKQENNEMKAFKKNKLMSLVLIMLLSFKYYGHIHATLVLWVSENTKLVNKKEFKCVIHSTNI